MEAYKAYVLDLFDTEKYHIRWPREKRPPWKKFHHKVLGLLQQEPTDRDTAEEFMAYLETIHIDQLG